MTMLTAGINHDKGEEQGKKGGRKFHSSTASKDWTVKRKESPGWTRKEAGIEERGSASREEENKKDKEQFALALFFGYRTPLKVQDHGR